MHRVKLKGSHWVRVRDWVRIRGWVRIMDWVRGRDWVKDRDWVRGMAWVQHKLSWSMLIMQVLYNIFIKKTFG